MAYKVYSGDNDSERLIGYGGRGAKQKMLKALRILNYGDHPMQPSFSWFRGLDAVYYFFSTTEAPTYKTMWIDHPGFGSAPTSTGFNRIL